MTNVWTRLIAAGEGRKTRLHDANNVLIPGDRLLRNGPMAVATGIGRLAFGWRPALPWISYDGQQMLDAFLKPSMRVLEFGSGMSTLWYAQRVGEVVTVENDARWFEKVKGIARARGFNNITYHFAGSQETYLTLTPAERATGFDMIMIDGDYRDLCVDVARELLRPGGIIYLDNADMLGPNLIAKEKLLDWVRAVGGEQTFITDFAPTQFFVQTGLLVRAPA